MKSNRGNQTRQFNDPLFDRLPARKDDPETSKIAARKLQADGRQALKQQQALAIVKANPGITAQEVSAIGGEGLWKRLSELQRKGLIEKRGKRICTITGEEAITWFLVEEGA